LPSTYAVCTFRRNRECRISANTCHFCSYTPLMPYNHTQLSESCKGYHGPTYFMHYVFTQIFRYSHAVLNCASMKTDVWTCPDQLTSLEQASGIAGPVLP
ncbi:hypothetical protein T11_9397, partial [Trichinella zimbabwensis]